MTHGLRFVPDALEERVRLDGSVNTHSKAALKKRLGTPRVPDAEPRSPPIELDDTCMHIQ
ncbi:hypothetical protein C0Z18_27590 [Trinickia dabaoshanensis]|uniref:Uncharacterized protein n=1 Tax=Trinickia dabaoshanensis TaxID=564714 RepID=A0A2N7VDM5_9BURK|nr:hypothetical protein C0Z18_27590 [Trinickia dabaoshanensis]